ncbi:aspartate aminotransferase [Paramyrothecium foliicola]|nr:aspartate aminotransferase [Paramyrothecium foliicola]
MYAAARTIYWFGHIEIIYIITVVLANRTMLQTRTIMFGVNPTPSIINTFAGHKIAELFLKNVNYRSSLLVHFQHPGTDVGLLVMRQVLTNIEVRVWDLTAQFALMASERYQDGDALARSRLFGSIGVPLGFIVAGALLTSTVPTKLYDALPSDNKNLTQALTINLTAIWKFCIAGMAQSSSIFASVKPAVEDGVFALEAAYQADKSPQKVNLGIGAYRDSEGNPWELPAVREAKRRLASETWTHEYLPLHGNDSFLYQTCRILLGKEIHAELMGSIASIQTVSGSGANSLIARFCIKHLDIGKIWFPNPTWGHHYKIWSDNAPLVKQHQYPYYNTTGLTIDFGNMMDCLEKNAVEGDAILFHACAHNPTGVDPSQEQWREIATFCKDRRLFVIFDVAYQGFASGSLAEDAWAVRHFLSHPELDVAVCQSFSKNLGLYGERVGALHIIPSRATDVSATVIRSQLVDMQRCNISVAPRFGSQVAGLIMSEDELFSLWQEDLLTMSGRIKDMRRALHQELLRLETSGRWENIIQQSGMFSYTGLSAKMTERMKDEHHVYMLPSGRISIAGLNENNVLYVARAIHETVLYSKRSRQN